MNIHPTALIEEGAKIASDVQIGAYCVIGAHVKIESGAVLKSHVVVEGRTYIGEGTVVYPFTSLGSPPQDLKYDNEPSELIIGKNNVIREHVTMNLGTKGGCMKTVIGDDNLFMIGVHVAHDCVVGNRVIMANNAAIAGHVVVGDFVIIGALSGVHQFVRIGTHAIIGGMSGVDSDIIPYGRVKGERASLAGLNLIGLERQGFSKDSIKMLQKAFNELFASKGIMDERIEAVCARYDDETVALIVNFARQKDKFPLCQPPKKH